MNYREMNYDYIKNIKLLFNFRRYIPKYEITNLNELHDLLGSKYQGIIFDVDQTLVSYREDVVSNNDFDEISCLSNRYKCCLLSNFKKNDIQTARLNKISNQIGIPIVITNNKKPSPFAFNKALRTLELDAKEVVMIGDRIITDIIGANNLGITSIYRKPIDKNADPLLLVKIPRIIEMFLLKVIKNSIILFRNFKK